MTNQSELRIELQDICGFNAPLTTEQRGIIQRLERKFSEAIVDELTSLQHHGTSTNSFVYYRDIEQRIRHHIPEVRKMI